ncbi:helix-turn-helix domain-containing protein [Nonomuraea sp. NBC_01738]|uniref:helix-turn-helix domain-containing protein n=1 Tax=Nonomuraea sp. NBC_01738 TaxID=2976003 RepID=UPI002E14F3BC|nr:helix-turn-helix domain-containing protein [Nonomuraea sp. NBC_01738]
MTELKNQVRELRGQGKSPKEIARELGVKPSIVAPLVRSIAAEAATDAAPALVGAWVNTGWSAGLSIDPARGWQDEAPVTDSIGLVSVLVARKHGFDRMSVCGYLADVYCLGVKNTHGPVIMDEREFRAFREYFFSDYPSWQEVPLDLAVQIVYGSADYASGLGFDPHEDFEGVKSHLADWEGPSAITFGRDGKPYYVSGPYDDASKVIRRLQRVVGDEFDYMILETPEED